MIPHINVNFNPLLANFSERRGFCRSETAQKIAIIAYAILVVSAAKVGAGISFVYKNTIEKVIRAWRKKPVPYTPIGSYSNCHYLRAKKREKAAVTLQAAFRGFRARKPFLTPNSAYKELCQKAHTFTRAKGGNTKVYLPERDTSIVLKQSGCQSKRRLRHMLDMRSILESQESTHLVIPKARLCGHFLIEERLPINIDPFHNMNTYISNSSLFDDAIRELTRLSSKVVLGDLIGSRGPLSHLPDVGDIVRYDNLPLYIVEEKGKIGLIDLELFKPIKDRNSLAVLARIFPYHLDIIKEEAEKLNMTIDHKALDSAAERGRKCMQVGFKDHLDFLKKKTDKAFAISPERIGDIEKIIEGELLKLNDGINDFYTNQDYRAAPPKEFLTENPQAVAKELASQIAPQLASTVSTVIQKRRHKEPTSPAELVDFRSPILKRSQFRNVVQKVILDHSKVLFCNTCLFGHERDIAEQIVYVFMNELVKGGELFYFDPAYYSNMADFCWIRY